MERVLLQMSGNSTIFLLWSADFVCFTFIKAWQRGKDWDVSFAVRGHPITEPSKKNRSASGPEELSKGAQSFQDLHCLYLSHTSECLWAVLFPTVSSATENNQSHQARCTALNWVVRRLRQWLLWDWNQSRPHSEFPASPECRVRMCLKIQTNELKDVWNKL